MRAVLNIVLLALDLYKYVIIASAVMSWLIAFNVVNIRNDVVRSIWNTLVALTEPLLAPIRRFLPSTGGIDSGHGFLRGRLQLLVGKLRPRPAPLLPSAGQREVTALARV